MECFHCFGTVPVCREVVKRFIRRSGISGPPSLIKAVEIPSGQGVNDRGSLDIWESMEDNENVITLKEFFVNRGQHGETVLANVKTEEK